MADRGDGKLNTIIGKGTTFTGDIEVSGGLRIDGRVEGNVTSEQLFVGREAEIVGNISTNAAVVGGKIWGNMTTSKLDLQEKAELYGDLTTKSITVSEGCVLQGNCDMGKADQLKKKGATAPAPKKAAQPAKEVTAEVPPTKSEDEPKKKK